MKLKINTKSLTQALLRAQKATSNRTTLPIISCALLEAKDGLVKVTGTDLDSRIETLVEAADVEIECEGSLCVSFNRLIAALRAPEAFMEADAAKLTIESGAKTTLGILRADDYPKRWDFQDFRPLDLTSLQSAVKQVHSVASVDTSRYTINGVCLSWSEDNVHAVATDGRSMAYIQIADMDDWNARDIIIPNSLTSAILSLPESSEAEWAILNGKMEIRTAATSLQGSLIEGAYPQWRQVIPNVDGNVILNKDELIEALSAVLPFCDSIKNGSSMTIEPKGDSWILNGGSGLDASSYQIAAKNQTLKWKFKLDPLLLKKLLLPWNVDNISVSKNDSAESPLLFKAEGVDLNGILMPLRLD